MRKDAKRIPNERGYVKIPIERLSNNGSFVAPNVTTYVIVSEERFEHMMPVMIVTCKYNPSDPAKYSKGLNVFNVKILDNERGVMRANEEPDMMLMVATGEGLGHGKYNAGDRVQVYDKKKKQYVERTVFLHDGELCIRDGFRAGRKVRFTPLEEALSRGPSSSPKASPRVSKKSPRDIPRILAAEMANLARTLSPREKAIMTIKFKEYSGRWPVENSGPEYLSQVSLILGHSSLDMEYEENGRIGTFYNRPIITPSQDLQTLLAVFTDKKVVSFITLFYEHWTLDKVHGMKLGLREKTANDKGRVLADALHMSTSSK
jgi:hypothetical protein